MKDDTEKKKSFKVKDIAAVIASIFGVLLLIFGIYYGYLYTSTPAHMRSPILEHYHFRTQIIVGGEEVDFSSHEFQEEYDASSCSVELTGQPIDFHDEDGQMTHIHWKGVTGGEFLKYYGWNLIGGRDDSLGTRFDQGMMRMHNIPIKDQLLPDVADNFDYYIYIGDEYEYEQKNWDEFLSADLEDFFGVESLLNTDSDESSFNILDLFTERAYAHDGVDDGDEEVVDGEETEEERLTRINNLVGNVVIFAQESEPTNEEIQARFNNLTPLTESTCGG